MKKGITLFISGLFFVTSGNISALNNNVETLEYQQQESMHGATSLGGGYAQKGTQIYYRGRVVNDASISSFKYLGDGYAKDSWKVFYNGRIIADASASSFECLEDGYAKDSWRTYYRGDVFERNS